MALSYARNLPPSHLPTHGPSELLYHHEDRIVVSAARPDHTAIMDFSAGDVRPVNLEIPGFFGWAAATTSDGHTIVAGRFGLPNPYRLYEMDVESGRLEPLDVEVDYDIGDLVGVSTGVLVVPSWYPAEAKNAVPLRLRRDATGRWRLDECGFQPLPIFHAAVRGRHSSVRAVTVDDANTFLIWNERVHRFDGERCVVVDGAHLSPMLERGAGHRDVTVDGGVVTVDATGLVMIDREGSVRRTCSGIVNARGLFPLDDEAVFVWQGSVLSGVAGVIWRPATDTYAIVKHDEVWTSRRHAVGFARLASRPWLFGMIAGGVMLLDVSVLLAIPQLAAGKYLAKHRQAFARLWKQKVQKLEKTRVQPVAWPVEVTHDGARLVAHPDHGLGVVEAFSRINHRGALVTGLRLRFEAGHREYVWDSAGGWIEYEQ